MTVRDDLVPVVDSARQVIADMGLRRHEVIVQRRIWSGAQLGLGTVTTQELILTPTPKVSDVPERLLHISPGKYEVGDRLVRKISVNYCREELDGGELPANVELVWRVAEAEYSLQSLEERNFEWVAQLRRRSRKRG